MKFGYEITSKLNNIEKTCIVRVCTVVLVLIFSFPHPMIIIYVGAAGKESYMNGRKACFAMNSV